MSSQQIEEFRGVTGANDKQAKKFLKDANNNLELALSMFFDAGIVVDSAPPPVAPPVFVPPPVVEQPENVTQEELDTIGQLIAKSTNRPVTLEGIRVYARILVLVAEVEATQRFVNTTGAPIEATFQFRSTEASVCGFEARVRGRRIIGQVQEKKAAFQVYDTSIARGDGAYLLEQGAQEDSFKLSVGNLPPGEAAEITLKYVFELDREDDKVIFRLPLTRAPITLPAGGSSAGGATDAHRRGGEADMGRSTLSGLEVEVEITTASPITTIVSPSHHHEATRPSPKFATVRIGESKTGARQELILHVGTEDARIFAVDVERSRIQGSEAALMMTFLPVLDDSTEDEKVEVIFLVDRSGSMAGGQMNQAKNALQLFLRSLPMGTMFNIVGFGSRYEKLFDRSVPYSEATLAQATQHVANMKADLVATNILDPLRDILQYPANPTYLRQLFVLTDGEVNNTDEVIRTVDRNLSGARVFTFGIGADASRALVNGMARAGNGAAEFVQSGERLEAKVLRQLARALQPVFKNARIDWGSMEGLVSSTPATLPPVFTGEPLIVYGLTQRVENTTVTLHGTVKERPVSYTLQVDAEEISNAEIVHKLTVRSMLRDYEKNKVGDKDRLIQLACDHGVASKLTSFVAVEPRDEPAAGEMSTVAVDEAERDLIASREVKVFLAPDVPDIPYDPEPMYDDMGGGQEYYAMRDQNARLDVLEGQAMMLSESSRSYGASDRKKAGSSARGGDGGARNRAAPAPAGRAMAAEAPASNSGGGGGGGVTGFFRGLFGKKDNAAPAAAAGSTRADASMQRRSEPTSTATSASIARESVNESMAAYDDDGAASSGSDAEADEEVLYEAQAEGGMMKEEYTPYGDAYAPQMQAQSAPAQDLFGGFTASGLAGPGAVGGGGGYGAAPGYGAPPAAHYGMPPPAPASAPSPVVAANYSPAPPPPAPEAEESYAPPPAPKSAAPAPSRAPASAPAAPPPAASTAGRAGPATPTSSLAQPRKPASPPQSTSELAQGAKMSRSISPPSNKRKKESSSEDRKDSSREKEKRSEESPRSSSLASTSIRAGKAEEIAMPMDSVSTGAPAVIYPASTSSEDGALFSDRALRPIDQIVRLQTASGAWGLTGSLARILGIAYGTLRDSIPAAIGSGGDESAARWATALAIIALEVRFGDVKDEWTILARKARRWLDAAVPNSAEFYDAARAVLTK